MAFDEMNTGGEVRGPYAGLDGWLGSASHHVLKARSAEAEALFRRRGVTFCVYGDTSGVERLIPFDVVPRVLGVLGFIAKNVITFVLGL